MEIKHIDHDGTYAKCTAHSVLMCVKCRYSEEHTCSQCGDFISNEEARRTGGYCSECEENELMGNEYGGI